MKRMNPRYQNDIYEVRESNKTSFFVPFNVPSLKNGRKIIFVPSPKGEVIYQGDKCTAKLTSSPQVKKYFKLAMPYYDIFKPLFFEITKDKMFPIKVELLFHRQGFNDFDFPNMTQIILDCIKKAKWIPDDDMKHILPFPPKDPPYYIIDKLNPGVKITIL